MAQDYFYKAYDRHGHAIEGKMQGESAKAVSGALTRQGYIPVSVSESKGVSILAVEIFGHRVKSQDIVLFTRQLWTMLKTGIPLQSSLVFLSDEMKDAKFKKTLQDVIKDLEAGSTLSDALSRHPSIFEPLYVNMVKAGEASGKLDETLRHVAELREFEMKTRGKIQAAVRYPILATVSLALAFSMIVTFVIPKFMNLFNQYKAELPLPTRILLGINYVIRHDWPAVLIGLAATVFLLRYAVSTARGRYLWDLAKIKMPVFGPLNFNMLMARFAKVVSELLASGLPIIQTLQLVSTTVGNEVLRKAILSIQASVVEGKGISQPMKQSGFFSPMVVQMVAIGEQSGKIDELLAHIAGYYEEQADLTIKNLTSLIEPILLAAIGATVLLLALGVFMPMWDLVRVFK